MNVQEAIKMLEQGDKNSYEADCTYEEYCEAIEMGRKSLEMQDKLKQWIEGYKRQEFADMTLTRDGLIDILNEFRLECAE